jgi:hypothetical protein
MHCINDTTSLHVQGTVARCKSEQLLCVLGMQLKWPTECSMISTFFFKKIVRLCALY